jgi:hypothetical protein
MRLRIIAVDDEDTNRLAALEAAFALRGRQG